MVRTRGSQNQVSPPLHPLETKKQHSKRKHGSNCNFDPPPSPLKKMEVNPLPEKIDEDPSLVNQPTENPLHVDSPPQVIIH